MISVLKPWIDEDELQELTEVIRSGWITEASKTRGFEEAFCQLTGAGFAIAVANGTCGLFMALRAFGIGPGDEVLVPDLTFIATANAVLMAGAKPRFVDIEAQSFGICPKDLERRLTDKTRAILPVHLYGNACEMEKICEFARRYGLVVIEDAAQGVGVRWNGRHVGTFAEVGAFSFYGNKTITTGEGGLLVTDDEGLARELYALKNHGRLEKGTFIHERVGFNFSFTELQAAFGLAQLRKLPAIIERKRQIFQWYRERLDGIRGIEFPPLDPRCQNVFWLVNILVENAGELQQFLAEKEIQARRFFHPLHRQPCYGGCYEVFPNTDYVYQKGLSLPSYPELTEEDVSSICDVIARHRGILTQSAAG